MPAFLPAIYSSLDALRAKNREKVSKKVLEPSGPESQKSPEKVEKSQDNTFQSETFRGLSDVLESFLRLRAGMPGKTFCGFRPGGPRDCRRWPAGTHNNANNLSLRLKKGPKRSKAPQTTPLEACV